jgi:thymidylate synthase (FAD)
LILVKPSYQILAASGKENLLPYTYSNSDQLIEYAGRKCYKSEDKITINSSKQFVENLKKSKHLSVIEHSWELRVYDCEVPFYKYLNFLKLTNNTGYVVAGNLRAFKEWDYDKKDDCCYPTKEILSAIYHNKRWDLLSATVEIITNRSITHELVRHRPASFSQESTRYCNYSKDKFTNNITCVIPSYFQNEIEEGIYNGSYTSNSLEIQTWFDGLINCEKTYLKRINSFKSTAARARGNLPQDLKAEIIITADLDEWKNIIFKLRGQDSTSDEEMKNIIIPIQEEFKKLFPEIFEKRKLNR